MPRNVDLQCPGCETVVLDQILDVDALGPACPTCAMIMEQAWWRVRQKRRPAQWLEPAVVYVNPTASDPAARTRYPGQNNLPTPEGYERVEIRSDAAMGQFEREHNVLNESRWFDRGTGRGFDDFYRGEKVT